MRTWPSPAGRLALAALATWRVTHLLAEEDGPGDIVVRLRRRAGPGLAGDLMDCFYCLSAWVAVPFSLGLSRGRRFDPVAWLAVSGAACLLEQATRPPGPAGHQPGAAHHPTHTHSSQEVPIP